MVETARCFSFSSFAAFRRMSRNSEPHITLACKLKVEHDLASLGSVGWQGTDAPTLLNALLVLDTPFMNCLCVRVVLHPHFAVVTPKHGVGLPKLRSKMNL